MPSTKVQFSIFWSLQVYASCTSARVHEDNFDHCVTAVHNAYSAWRTAGTTRSGNTSWLRASSTEFELDLSAIRLFPCRKVAIVLSGLGAPQTLFFETACAELRDVNPSSGLVPPEDWMQAGHDNKNVSSVPYQETMLPCCEYAFDPPYGSWAKHENSWSWRPALKAPETGKWYQTWNQACACLILSFKSPVFCTSCFASCF